MNKQQKKSVPTANRNAPVSGTRCHPVNNNDTIFYHKSKNQSSIDSAIVMYAVFAGLWLLGMLCGLFLAWGISCAVEAGDVAQEAAQLPEERVERFPAPVESKDNGYIDETVMQEDPGMVTLHEADNFILTAYCTCPACCGIWSDQHPSRIGTDYVQTTFSGTIPTEGRTVAVDPNVIPLGSIVLIGGVEYIAEDTGSAVKGKHVDIYFESHEKAVEFGRQSAHVAWIE